MKFRFHYIDKIKPAFTPAALAFGIAFHAAVEEALVQRMAGDVVDVAQLVGVVAKSLDERAQEAPIRFGERESRETMLDQATRMLVAWVDSPRPLSTIIAVEHEIRFPLAEWLPPLVGRVDLIEAFEDRVEVVDVKTSRGKWDGEDVRQHASQLSLYAAGVADIVREIGKPVRYGFEVVTKAKAPTVERFYLDGQVEPLDRQIRTSTLVLEAVERGIYIPSPGWQCAGCPFKGACRSW